MGRLQSWYQCCSENSTLCRSGDGEQEENPNLDPKEPWVSEDKGGARGAKGANSQPNSSATQEGRDTGANNGSGMAGTKYTIVASHAGSSVSTEVSRSAGAAYGAEVEDRDCRQSNIDSKKRTGAMPSAGLNSAVCGRERSGYDANRPKGSVTFPDGANKTADAIILAKSWTRGEPKTNRQSRSFATLHTAGMQTAGADIKVLSTRLNRHIQIRTIVNNTGSRTSLHGIGEQFEGLIHSTCRQ